MHHARKRFGQHFLHDSGVIGRIVDAIGPKPQDRMVEIGPGLGAITLPLLKRVDELFALEIDRDVIRRLRELALENGTLHIQEADVLSFELAGLRNDARRLRVVGNLPYNISTPLLFRLIEQRDELQDLHVMLQKEVVQRMAAAPGSKHYGRLTVMLAPWLRVEPLFDIGAGAFRPPPRVVSSFARLIPHPTPSVPMDYPAQYARVVAAAFSQRRKTLRNALKPLLSEDEIASSGVSPGARAETIPPVGYAGLAAQLAAREKRIADGG